jgi:hypothetical protein
MLNVSPIGRSCSQAERDEFVEFERTHPIRVEFVKALEEKFSDYGLVDILYRILSLLKNELPIVIYSCNLNFE